MCHLHRFLPSVIKEDVREKKRQRKKEKKTKKEREGKKEKERERKEKKEKEKTYCGGLEGIAFPFFFPKRREE